MTKQKKETAAEAKAALTVVDKIGIANAICGDARFTHAEARVAVTMIFYFHNQKTGGLFPTRAQIAEQSCVRDKEAIISATRKMRQLGYLAYDESKGGNSQRNQYRLKLPASGTCPGHQESE